MIQKGCTLILLGAPHSGKSSLSSALRERHGFCCFDFGAFLRQLVENDCRAHYMQEVRDVLEGGSVLSDSLAEDLFNQVAQVGTSANFATDGFPRTIGSVPRFRKFLKLRQRDEKKTLVVHLSVDLDRLPDMLRTRGRSDDMDEKLINDRIATYQQFVVPTYEKLREEFATIELHFDSGFENNLMKLMEVVECLR